MTRTTRRALAALALVVAALLGPLGAGHPSSAYAAESTPAASQRVTWLTEYGSFSLDGPRGWRVTRPAEPTGRLTSPDGALRLSLTELAGPTTVGVALADRVAAIGALDDTTVLGTGRRTLTPSTGGFAGIGLALGDLTYRWRDTTATSRLVLTRFIGLDLQQDGGPTAIYEVTVSGPADRGHRLRAMLHRVTPSVFSTP